MEVNLMSYKLSTDQKEKITSELVNLAECSKDGDTINGYTARICFDLCLDDIRESSVGEYFPQLNIYDNDIQHQAIHDAIQCYIIEIAPAIIKTQNLGE
jgi:hypothetical protein